MNLVRAKGGAGSCTLTAARGKMHGRPYFSDKEMMHLGTNFDFVFLSSNKYFKVIFKLFGKISKNANRIGNKNKNNSNIND